MWGIEVRAEVGHRHGCEDVKVSLISLTAYMKLKHATWFLTVVSLHQPTSLPVSDIGYAGTALLKVMKTSMRN